MGHGEHARSDGLEDQGDGGERDEECFPTSWTEDGDDFSQADVEDASIEEGEVEGHDEEVRGDDQEDILRDEKVVSERVFVGDASEDVADQLEEGSGDQQRLDATSSSGSGQPVGVSEEE